MADVGIKILLKKIIWHFLNAKIKKKKLITQFSFHYLCSSRVLPYNQSLAKIKP